MRGVRIRVGQTTLPAGIWVAAAGAEQRGEVGPNERLGIERKKGQDDDGRENGEGRDDSHDPCSSPSVAPSSVGLVKSESDHGAAEEAGEQAKRNGFKPCRRGRCARTL